MATSEGDTRRLMVIVFTDIEDSSALKIQLGDQAYVEEIARPHNEMFRTLLKKYSGAVERAYTGDGFMATFASVGDAVTFALLFHHALRTARWGRVIPKTRIGIHLGDTIEFEGKSSQETSLASHAADMTARVMSLGEGGQTLMTRAAFDSARQSVRAFTLTDDSAESEVEWLAHGRYRFKGREEPMEIFEVGVKRAAPLRAPRDSEKAKHVLSDDGALTPGWQAAEGKENPARPDRTAGQELGEGGFGDFIGRESQIAEVGERLKAHRLVTLVGPGGMGKTRLVLEIIKRKKGDATHGAVISFVSFELVTENSEGAILDTLVAGLKLVPGDAGDLRKALVRRLNEASVLLILDNCETARSSVASVVRCLLSECPSLRILATSQHQLGLLGLEAVYELPPMTVPEDRPGSLESLEILESYKLFVARAQMADASWMPEANGASSFRRVLQLTDGIPLAIEIIAAWATIVSLTQICEELTQTPLGCVTEVDGFSSVAPERHRSMLRCLEWSLRHLSKSSPKDAAGFQRLGVFAGRFAEEGVGKVCEVEAPRELLAHLVKVSLVRPCPGTDPRRFSMLRYTRAFAQEKARSSGIERPLTARHVDFFSNLTVQLSEEGQWEMAQLASPEEDCPDLLAAAAAAPRIGKPSAVWRISRALSPFLLQRGLWSERERLNRAAVKAATDASYWGALFYSHIDLGVVLEAQGKWSEAVEQYELSLFYAEHKPGLGPPSKARALQHLSAVYMRMGDQPSAERAREKLDEVSLLLEEPKAKARALEAAGNTLENRGDLVNAVAKYREAFQIRESIGDADGMAATKSKLGKVLTQLRDWEPAERELHQSLDYWASRANEQQQGILLHQLADLFRRRGQFSQARDYCNQSLTFLNGFPKTRATSLALLATILCALGDTDGALAALNENQKISDHLCDTEGQGIALDRIGEIHTQLKQWELALNALEASRRIKELPGRRDLPGLGITHDLIARLYTQQGRWSEALVSYESSLRCLEEAGKTVAAAVTMISMAMMHAAQGRKGSSLETLDRAITSLQDERSGAAVAFKARQLRYRINRKMKEGVPWQDWEPASFVSQSLSIRRKFERETNDGRWREAAAGYEALAEDFSGNGRMMEAGLALNELGRAYRHLGDYARAEAAISKALTLFEQIPLPAGSAASWHKLGDLLNKQNEWVRAAEAYSKSIEIKREWCNEEAEAISQDPLFDVLVKIGRFEEAERAVSRSWEIVSEIGTTRQKWHPLIRLLWLKVHQNDLPGAKGIAVALTEAVRGNRELVATADELRAMADAGNWDGVKNHLARIGITGPAEIPASEPPAEAPNKTSAASCSLRRRGQGWEICFKGDGPFQLNDTVGVQYLATLLGTPGEPIHCSQLASSKGRAAVSSNLSAENTPVLTPEAKRAYRVKLAELKEQIATAESRGQVDETVDLKEEAEEIEAALGAAHDKLGGDQSLTDGGNRVRNAVCNPIRRVMNSLRDDPQTREIGLHLIDQVDLGFNCIYPKNKEKGFSWVVEQ